MDIPPLVADKINLMKKHYDERFWHFRKGRSPMESMSGYGSPHRPDADYINYMIQQGADEREAIFYAVAMAFEEETKANFKLGPSDECWTTPKKETTFAELEANSIKIPLEKMD